MGALAFYAATAAPTVLWGDDAELQRIVVTGEARAIGQSSRASHLLWLAVTSLFVRVSAWLPLDPAGRATLVSAISAALALPFIYAAATELASPLVRRPWIAGVVAVTAFGLSHTFWLLAARPDVYTLQTALLAIALWGVLRWRRGHPVYLAASALAVAAALTNHVMILASAPGLAALALAVPSERRRRLVVPSGAAAVAGLLVLLAAAGRGGPLDDLVRAVLSYRPQLPSTRDTLLVPVYLAYQFPLSLLLAGWGVYGVWRGDRGAFYGLALLYAGNMLPMLLRHHPAMYVRDQFIFYLPSYVPVALWIGVGAASVLIYAPSNLRAPWAQHRRSVVVAALLAAPLLLYPLAATIGGTAAIRLAPARLLPGRDPVAYYLLPSKAAYTGARNYGESVLAALEPNAAIVADWLPYQTLRYLQAVEGVRPDVLLAQINAGNRAQLQFLLAHRNERPLYLADASPFPYYEMEDIQRCFSVAKHGMVYRLTPRGDAGDLCPLTR
ncbi:MAG: DUF2723 domain-containing protein [Chloroflexi bacterium]|nr:DUF2723 domain-containing protein [Chloroflexota bacterium]